MILPIQASTQTGTTVVQNGIGIGAAIAIVCSWERNRSILWAILSSLV